MILGVILQYVCFKPYFMLHDPIPALLSVHAQKIVGL